jgi:hypothetical protein
MVRPNQKRRLSRPSRTKGFGGQASEFIHGMRASISFGSAAANDVYIALLPKYVVFGRRRTDPVDRRSVLVRRTLTGAIFFAGTAGGNERGRQTAGRPGTLAERARCGPGRIELILTDGGERCCSQFD